MGRINRRKFIRQSAVVSMASGFMTVPMRGASFLANETVNIAIIGLGGRSYALAQSIGLCENIRLTHACDVDAQRVEKFLGYAEKTIGYTPERVADFRSILENKNVDAIAIATPEHWHAPMAIMGLQSGKHVYVEKPCSHNPAENEMLVAAYKKAGLVCQMGNQQRSAVTSIEAISKIRDGLIGEVYYGKAWYANRRGSIGKGQQVPVPDYLDWDLWQGPAPREEYRDNVHPYNWHWFRTWGTGEIHNNGTHEIDICRWALNLKFPKRVVSTGGRLHFKDDWQWYDTQVANFEFEGGKTIIWEGRSCNNTPQYGRGRGSIVHGTKGTVILDRGGYVFSDLDGKEISVAREPDPGTSGATSDTSGFDRLTVRHMQNFVDAIRTGVALNAPIDDGSISTQLCHLGNFAQDLRTSLDIDEATGVVLNNSDATAKWGRDYEPGWEPKV